MKRWKLLAITFLCAAVSMGGWWSSYPGPSPHSIPDIDLQAQYSGVGQCPNGFWVNGLNHDAPPTCSQVDFEQIIGEISSNQIPAGIVLQQPILNSPTLDGTTTFGPGSIINYDPTSVITFPDGSTWTAAGIANSTFQGLVITGPVGVVGTINVDGNVDVTGVVSVPSINTNSITLTGPGGNWTFSYNGTSTAQINWPPNGSVFITQVSPSGYLIAGNGNPFSILMGPPQRVEIGTNWTLRVVGGIAEPATALPGSFYYNQTGNYMEYWNGTTWVSLAGLTGGACDAGDFVNSINSAGVITCGTPSGGGGSLPTPVSIGNGGLGQGMAPSAGQILVASGTTAYNPVTMTGDVTISPTGVTTVTSPVIVSGLAPPSPRDAQLWFNSTDLQTYIWYNDGTSSQWVPVVNLTGGGDFLPINNPTYTGTLSGPIAVFSQGMVVTNPLDATSQVAISAGNVIATGVGQFGGTVTGAPATQPTNLPTLSQVEALIGASGPWLPVNNPTFTGVMTAPGAAAAEAGGQTWDATGLGQIGAIGINISNHYQIPGAANPSAPNAILFNPGQGSINGTVSQIFNGPINNQNSNSFMMLQGALVDTQGNFVNTSPGLSPTILQLSNANVVISSGAPTAVGATFSTTTLALFSRSATSLFTDSTLAFRVNSTGVLVPGSTGTGPVTNSIYYGFAAPYVGATSVSPGNFVNASQAHTNGQLWVADGTTAVLQNLSSASGGIAFYSDTGLTVGQTFTPTIIAEFTPTGGLSIPNAGTGGSVQAGVFLQSSDHTLQIAQLGSGWTANPFFPPDSSILMTDAPRVFLGSYSPSSTINFNLGGAYFGRFINNAPANLGLELPGFASVVGDYTAASLHIGNAYVGAYNWASLDISGAVFNNGNVNWVADGGAGSGAALFQMGPTCFTMYNWGGGPAGTIVSWNVVGQWCGTGEAAGHISNLTSERIPTVSSGTTTADSRDTFGWVTNVTGGQTTITFAEPYITQSNCSLTASGTPYTWFNANQSPTQDTFVCVVPWTGEQCPDNVTVEYHCFGQAGLQVAGENNKPGGGP